MSAQHRRPKTRIGRILNTWWMWTTTAGLLIGYALYGASTARADGTLDQSEANYVNTNWPAVCAVLDKYPSRDGVTGLMIAIVKDGYAIDSSVDIINESVYEYCPRHWPLLQAVGRQARAENGAPA